MKSVDTLACEFGYELIMVVPYVHYLHKNNIEVQVHTCVGMKPFYYFLNPDNVHIKYNKRRGAIPNGTPLRVIHFNTLDTSKWDFPPLKAHYKDFKLKTVFEKEPLVISNKYTTEWGHSPINYLPVEVLDVLLEGLTQIYTVIYNRPLLSSITQDHSVNLDLGDYELIRRKYPTVIEMNNLQQVEGIDYNLLQIIVGSKTDKYISVQGGNSILNSLFGGTNLVYAKKGSELTHNSFKGWYSNFSGCKVVDTSDYAELIQLIQQNYIDEQI